MTAAMAALVVPAYGEPFSWNVHGIHVKAVGYVQNDVRTFWGWEADAGQRNDGFDVRQMRGGLRLTRGRVSGQAVVDVATFANRALGDSVAALFVPRQRFKDVYVDVALGRGQSLRVGHFKLPVSREFLVAEQRTDFLERAMFSSGLAPSRDWGAMAQGRLAVAARRLEYLVGVYAGDNWSDACRARNTIAGRLVLEAVKGLQLGVSGSRGDLAPATGDGTGPPARGLQGKSASGWVFFKRPAVEGARRRLGADVQEVAGAVTFTAEVLQSREARPTLPAVLGLGGSVSALWHVRAAKASRGGGVLDLAARYEWLRFANDDGARPSSQAMTAALNYQPRPWLRFMANGIADRYGDGARVPDSAHRGYVTLLARVQLVVP
jgi:phosphate-selective porin